jgi:aminopeptidase-like protein
MHELCRVLFPICRSITGAGVRQTLAILQQHVPELRVTEVPTGTKCFDWEVPREWNISDAYIIAPDGRKLCDFQASNLHVVGYSMPVDRTVSLEELQEHLHSLPRQPDAIPYITSYYKETWGFCIAHHERLQLRPGAYRVVIDSELGNGSLTYGDVLLQGSDAREVLVSTNVCHPSMANNELSGPVVATFIAKWLTQRSDRRLSYRIVFVPETVGAIAYLSRNLAAMRSNVIAGFTLSCIGDDRAYSYLASRRGETLADRAALHVLRHRHPDFVRYSFLERGSDERQYCSPGIDLPVCSLMRTIYGGYPEYHTSLDNLSVVTAAGLAGGYEVLRTVVECLEANVTLRATVACEPHMGGRGLYPTLSVKEGSAEWDAVWTMMNVLAYADGRTDLLGISDALGVPAWTLVAIVDRLKREGLVESAPPGG